MDPTQQIPFAPKTQTPAGVFSQCMQHMVQKAYPGPYPNVLSHSDLGGMSFRILRRDRGTLEFGVGFQKRERSTIEAKVELDLGFFGVAGNKGFPTGEWRGRHYLVKRARSDLKCPI